MSPANAERTYITTANRIVSGRLTTKQEIFRELEALYPNDDLFESAFKYRQFSTMSSRNRKIIKYILLEIEKHASQNAFDLVDSNITIEHICPESPEAPAWTDKTLKQVYRIGNTTLMHAKANREIANKPYTQKTQTYAASTFQITRTIPKHYDTWNEATIAARQTQLAKQAKAIWKLNFL